MGRSDLSYLYPILLTARLRVTVVRSRNFKMIVPAGKNMISLEMIKWLGVPVITGPVSHLLGG